MSQGPSDTNAPLYPLEIQPLTMELINSVLHEAERKATASWRLTRTLRFEDGQRSIRFKYLNTGKIRGVCI